MTPASWPVRIDQNLVRLAIVRKLANRPAEVVAGSAKSRTIELRLPRHEQSFHHDAGVVDFLGKLHPLGGQVHAQAEISANGMPLPDTENDCEQLQRLPDPLTQLMRPVERRSDFGRGITARSDVRGTQGTEEFQFPGVPLG